MIGVQLVGEVPPTGLWCPKPYAILAKDRSQAIPLSTFHRQHAREAGKIKRIVEKRAATAADNKEQKDQIQAIYNASMAEIEAGTASGPFTYSYLEKRFGYGKFRPMMRSTVCLLADNTEERVAQRIYGYAHETKKQQSSDEGISQHAQAFPIRKGNRIKRRTIRSVTDCASSILLSPIIRNFIYLNIKFVYRG
jgi:hypothetical protein